MFRVGQKVVCVDARPGDWTGHADLRLNAVYVIEGCDPECDPMVSLYLAGLPKRLKPLEPDSRTPIGWCARRFRPVVERKTSIEIFTAMLNPKKQKVRA